MAEEFRELDRAALAWAVRSGLLPREVAAARIGRGEAAVTCDELAEITRQWEAAGRPPYEPHVHRTAVQLVDGTSVTPVSYLGADPYHRSEAPAFGLYLDARWAPPWPHEHVVWPDLGVPSDPAKLRASLRQLLARARRGEVVEFGCLGGHGRTGTALACLAVLAGTRAGVAVDWVRANYCPDAIETDEQRAFVETFEGLGDGQRE